MQLPGSGKIAFNHGTPPTEALTGNGRVITLYTWGTPNGRKVSIMLEECGLAYDVKAIDISAGDQFHPEFLAVNPNGKIPALVDDEVVVFESGAILIYLAEKTGRFLPAVGPERYAVLQWLMFQMGGIGPMFGQTHHFRRFAPAPVPYALERYGKETNRLYGVLDGQLAQHEFMAGAAYSIADIATYPWVTRHEWQGVDLAEFPHVRRWAATLADRPAVRRGMDVPDVAINAPRS